MMTSGTGVPEEDDELLDEEDELLDDELLDEEDPVWLVGSSPPPQPTAPRMAISGNIARSIRIVDTLLAHRFFIRDKDSIIYIDAPTKNASDFLFDEIVVIFFKWDFIDIESGSFSH